MNVEKIRLKAYSLKELAYMYECSNKTMRKWINELAKETGPRIGNYYTPRQVQIIFRELGLPDSTVLN